MCDEARRPAVDGVICGHVHTAEIKNMQGFAYINVGDWVESCTALVEHPNGELEILRWADEDQEAGQIPPSRLSKAAA